MMDSKFITTYIEKQAYPLNDSQIIKKIITIHMQ